MSENSSVNPTAAKIKYNENHPDIVKSKADQKKTSQQTIDYAESIPLKIEDKIIGHLTKRFGKH